MDSGGSKGAKPVPKFSSFKPKPVPPPTEDHRKGRREDEKLKSWDDDDTRRKSKSRSHRHRSRSREYRSRHEYRKDESKHRPREDVAERQAPQLKPAEKEQDLYIVDRKGDIYNVTYGTIHRYNVPQYRRVGQGRVLGLSGRYKIDRDFNDEGAVLIRADAWQGDGTRHRIKNILSKANTRSMRLLRVRRETTTETTDAQRDFLPLNTHGSRKRRRVSGAFSPSDISDSEAETSHYRSILGKAKPDEDVPSDMEITSASDSAEDGATINWERTVGQRNSELSRRVEERPQDIDAWVELIDYQDRIIAGSEESRQLSTAEKSSLADIKLSLYDKALKRVGASVRKDRLLLGYLMEGTKLWESKKLSEQWNAILKHNPGYVGLWVKYLDFRQTEFLDFTYERCKLIFIDCLKLNASSADSAEKDMIQTYLFLRMTLFMREAGFSELATGLWQAILEFVLFRPSNSEEDLISSFVAFWDSEAARIGESGAKGWRNSNVEIDPIISSSQTTLLPRSLFASWVEAEMRLRRTARLPARTLDEVENDDPFRVVLSSDIQEFLTYFENWRSQDILIRGFISFCHLPPLASALFSENSRSQSGDPFLRNELVGLSDSTLTRVLNVGQLDESETSKLATPVPLENITHTVENLFGEDKWFSSLATWKTMTVHGDSPVDAEWVRRAFRLLVDTAPMDDALAEYALAVEFAINPKDAKKYAKTLLKKRSSSLRLYNAYALMESRSGNITAAAHVLASTLSMVSNLTDQQKLEYGPLLRTVVWEALMVNKKKEALEVLLSIPNFALDVKSLGQGSMERVVSPTELLKSQRFLSEMQEHSLAIRKVTVYVSWTECLALLHYLTHSLDLAAAIDIIGAASKRLSSSTQISTEHKSFTIELLHQHRCRLLYQHVQTINAHKPSYIRSLLQESISLFPHNTMFLSLFAWNETRFRIDDRVRDVMRDVMRPESSLTGSMGSVPVTSHLFAISHEAHRPVYSGSTQHSVRAAFERALSDEDPNNGSRSSLSLWKLYITFELFATNNVARAKDLFFRAMRTCPWSKDVLLIPFQQASLREEGFDFWELRKIYNVLIDKELRVHVDIDEDIFDKAEAMVIQAAQRMQVPAGGEGGSKSRQKKLPIHLPEDRDSDVDGE